MADTIIKSGICVGTLRKDGKLRILLRVPTNAADDYDYVVLSAGQTSNGSANSPNGKVVEIPISTFQGEQYLSIASDFPESEELRKIYAYMLTNVGTYFEVDEGSPISFFFTGNPTTIETAELGDGRFRLSIYDLEQPFSKENYNSITVTKTEIEEGTDELPSWYYTYVPTDATRNKTDINMISGSFDAGTYYVYKETKFGALYLIGKAKFESSQEPDVDVSDCRIDYEIIGRKYYDSEVSGVEAYVDNYIDITGESWSRFCDAINVVRASVGLSEAVFTNGDTLSANMWNEAMEAFSEAAEYAFCVFDTEKFTASRGMPITKELIDEVNSEISAILEEIT